MSEKVQLEFSIPANRTEREALVAYVKTYVEAHTLLPPLSMEELRDHALQVSPNSNLTDYLMVLLNNEVWHETVASVPYERRLLLLPQCLRDFKNCPAQMDEFGLLCEECGRCDIGGLQSMAEDLGYVVLIAEGSTVVSKLLEGGKVDAVIGVSCLSALEKSFPHMAEGAIPGLAIPLTVDGCIGTEMDTDHVRAAIELKSSNDWKNQMDTHAVRSQVETWFSEDWNCATQTERMGYDWLVCGGKRWRPFLLASTYSALMNGTTDFPDDIRKLAIAVECFHKASLVHDDIEDDDDLRYGGPTLHVQHGLAVAINLGDFLVGEGYRWIASADRHVAALMKVAVENHRTLCVGQGEELYGLATDHIFSTAEITEIFRQKTAPAFGVSLLLGAVAAHAEEDVLQVLRRFSESLGVAYQIKDDLEEYVSGEAEDLRASILLAIANDQKPMQGLNQTNPTLQHIFDELMVVEKASQLLEHYKNEAIRSLNALNNASLKSWLNRITFKMLGGNT